MRATTWSWPECGERWGAPAEMGGAGGPGWGWKVPTGICSPPFCPSPAPSSELCCKACVAFYHWVMVAVTGGVGVAATLALCSLLVWPVRLRSCELQAPPPHKSPKPAMGV